MAYKIKLQKGDMAVVLSGKFKGRTAKVVSTQPKSNTVTLEGINVVTRHVKPNQMNPNARTHEITRPLPASKVAFYDSTKKRGSRIGIKVGKDGLKARVMKSSGKEIK